MKKWLILSLALLFLSGCSFSRVRNWIEEMEWERDDETVSIVHSTTVAWGSDECRARTASESLHQCRIVISTGKVGVSLPARESVADPDCVTVPPRESPWGA